MDKEWYTSDMVWCYSGLKIDECNLKSLNLVLVITEIKAINESGNQKIARGLAIAKGFLWEWQFWRKWRTLVKVFRMFLWHGKGFPLRGAILAKMANISQKFKWDNKGAVWKWWIWRKWRTHAKVFECFHDTAEGFLLAKMTHLVKMANVVNIRQNLGKGPFVSGEFDENGQWRIFLWHGYQYVIKFPLFHHGSVFHVGIFYNTLNVVIRGDYAWLCFANFRHVFHVHQIGHFRQHRHFEKAPLPSRFICY